MAIVKTNNEYYSNIAKTIREKFDSSMKLRPDQMSEMARIACDYQHSKGYDEGHEVGEIYGRQETEAKILADCNAVAKLAPAETVDEIPRLIDDAYDLGYSTGTQHGHEIGYDTGYGNAEYIITQDCNTVIEKYTEPAEFATELPDKIEKVHEVSIGTGKQLGVEENMATYIRYCNIQGNFLYAFAGVGWDSSTTYKPDENTTLKCFTNSANMYAYSSVTDTVAPIDLSRATNNTGSIFANANKMVTIRKIIVSETTPTIGFTNCSKLQNITFEGVIGANANFQWCPLSRASIENIVSVLSTTVTGKTLTLKQSAVEAAFTTEEWETLAATKPNWTIALA